LRRQVDPLARRGLIRRAETFCHLRQGILGRMTHDDAPYWPHGFFAELDEIADTDELDSQRLDAMYERRQDQKFEALIRLHGRGILTA
jgi:hypothetical protein